MFANECFVRGRKDLLQSIQRRKPTTNQTIVQSKGEEQSPCTMPPLGSWPTPTMPKIVPGQVSGFSAFNLPFPVAAPMNANMSQTSVPFSSVLGQIGGLPPTLSGFGLSPNSWQQQLDVSAWQQKQLLHSSHPLPLLPLPDPQPASMMGAVGLDPPTKGTASSERDTQAPGSSAASGLDHLAALACEYFLPEQEKLSSTSSRQQASSLSTHSSRPSTSQKCADLESSERAAVKDSEGRHDLLVHKGSKRTRVSLEGVKEEPLPASVIVPSPLHGRGRKFGDDMLASENYTPGSSSMDREEQADLSSLQVQPHYIASIHEHLINPDADDSNQQVPSHGDTAMATIFPQDFMSQQQERMKVIEAELAKSYLQSQVAEERTRSLEAKNQELGTRLAWQEEVNLDQRRMNDLLEARVSELENQLKGRQENMFKGLEEGVKKLLSEYLESGSNAQVGPAAEDPNPLNRANDNKTASHGL